MYKRQVADFGLPLVFSSMTPNGSNNSYMLNCIVEKGDSSCLLYTSDAADERSSVDLGGRRIIKKKNTRPK